MCNYFSHDDNARNDIKMVKLRRSKDGLAKYGLFWMLIEMLADTPGYSLPIDFESIAWDLKTDQKLVKSVVEDFELFEIADEKFYSLSLNKRMELKEAKSKQARDAANKRWNNPQEKQMDSDSNADAMRQHSVSNAIKLNKSKVKEIKEKEDIKKKFLDNIFLTDVEYQKLITHFGNESTAKEKIEQLSNGIKIHGYKYKDHYLTILEWDRRDKKKNGAEPVKDVWTDEMKRRCLEDEPG